MKRLSKILAAVMCAAVVVGMLMIPNKAQAEDATLFTVHFQNGWFFEYKGEWYGIGSIDSYFKAGDKILVEETAYAPDKTVIIDVTKKVSEFAVSGNVTAILNGNAGFAYAVNGGTLVLNGTADKVGAYPRSVIQINGNVGYFEASYGDGVDTSFAVTGTVDHFKGRVTDLKTSPEEVYDIPAGKCFTGKNYLNYVQLETSELKTTPSTTPVVTATTPSGAKELDEVPKTGLTASGTVICLVMAAVFAFGAVLVAGKKTTEV